MVVLLDWAESSTSVTMYDRPKILTSPCNDPKSSSFSSGAIAVISHADNSELYDSTPSAQMWTCK